MANTSPPSDRIFGTDPATHLDSVNRAVFGLVIGSLVAVLCGFAVAMSSDGLVRVLAKVASTFAWTSVSAWAQTPDSVMIVAQVLAVGVTIGIVAIGTTRLYRRYKTTKTSPTPEPDEQPEETAGVKDALSCFRTGAIFVGWMCLFWFAINVLLEWLPQWFLNIVMGLIRIIFQIQSKNPVWVRIESIENSLHWLVIFPAIYLYCDSELKRAARHGQGDAVEDRPAS